MKFIYPPATQNCRQAWSRVLFVLIAYMEDEIDEKARHLNIGSTDEDGMTSTEVWAANREGLWNALGFLESRPELTV